MLNGSFRKVLKMEEFLYQLSEQILIMHALAEAHTTYGRMGIKVWIMKGEVYGRDLSPLAGMDKKQAGGKGGVSSWESTLIKVENQTLVKRK
jgi:small subunit ribosomal protein S3